MVSSCSPPPVFADPDEAEVPPKWWGCCCGCSLFLLSAAVTVSLCVLLVWVVVELWG